MKIEKNKIVFGGILLIVVLFIISYSFYILGDKETDESEFKNPVIPKLEQEQPDYLSKLDAINDLKEVRETNAPSIYDEAIFDSLGYFDSDLPQKIKEHKIDSLYNSGAFDYQKDKMRVTTANRNLDSNGENQTSAVIDAKELITSKEMALDHQLFFASNPAPLTMSSSQEKNIEVVVDGTQKVSARYRLKMRLTEDILINSKLIPRNTSVYGFISFKPNRAMINIESIAGFNSNLKAYDLQDGSEGIYVVNNFQAQARQEVIGDLVDEINVPGIPQVNGIKQLFQRDNRNISVIIINNYKLLLKN